MSDNRQRDSLTVPIDVESPHPNSPPDIIDPDICHTVMKSLPDGILLFDRERRIVAANDAIESLFGYSGNELISHSVDMLVPVEVRQRHIKQCDEFFANPGTRLVAGRDLRALGKNGNELAVSVTLGAVYSGDQLLACAVVRDVSERKHVETALRDAEAQVRLLLDSTDEAIYGLDMSGNATFCNRACVDTLGYERPEDLLGRNMHDLIHHTRCDGSAYPMKECRIYQAFRLGEGTHVDDEVLWKADGSSFPAEYRSLPIHRDGQLVGSVVTFLDVTEQKRVEDELRQKQSELTHVARLNMLGEMAAGLAHELNQPLTAVSALAEGALLRLERDKLSRTEFVSVCQRIAADAQRAGEIIRRLRKFVQKRKSERDQVCVSQLLRDVVKFTETDLRHDNITLRCRIPDELWKVEADSIEIQQVVVNLVRNGCDALEKSDCPRREIVIEARNKDSRSVEVVVSDSGPGISPDLASRVFEPFYTSKSDGLGIGLGICQSIIETHGGRIWVGEPSIGGASVHFELPAQMPQGDTYEI